MDLNPEIILLEVLEWLGWLVMLVGVVICGMNLRLSKWIWLIVAGQTGHLAIGLAYRFVLTAWVTQHQNGIEIVLLGHLANVVFSAFIVGGLAGMFHELRDHIRLLTHMAMRERQLESHS